MTGKARRFCGAKKKQGEGTCTRPAGWGTDHPGFGTCKLHFGKTKAAGAAAVKQQAAEALAKLNVEPVTDPLSKLAELAGQALAWRDTIAAKVNTLTSLRYEGGVGTEQLRSEVALFERALDRCNTILATMARLNIDERLARITEQQQEIVLSAIQAGFDAIELPLEQQQAARAAVVQKLREAA